MYGEKQKLRQQHENELGKTWAVSIKQVCSFSGIGVTYQRLLWIILRLYVSSKASKPINIRWSWTKLRKTDKNTKRYTTIKMTVQTNKL